MKRGRAMRCAFVGWSGVLLLAGAGVSGSQPSEGRCGLAFYEGSTSGANAASSERVSRTLTPALSLEGRGGSRDKLSRVSTGPDLIIADLQSVLRFGRFGDITAYAVGTNVCNIGDERVDWIANTNRHPVCVQGMYRLKDGRFEQIGMGWTWHEFFAVSQCFCGPCCDNHCCDPTNGTELGVGCSNPESAPLCGQQVIMSLRSEVNAHTGYFPYPLSAPPLPPEDDPERVLYRRIRVHDSDIDPGLNQGATYFVDALFIAADDAAADNGTNNASYRRVIVQEVSEDKFNVLVTGVAQRMQPAIRAWQDTDSSVVETDVQVPGEGLFILAAKATELGDGWWHYEYALQNLNSDRSAGSFSVPLPGGASIQNIGFHDVDYHSGEIYDTTDWSPTVEGEQITWATRPYDVDPNANALRFATLYNFRFDANVYPGEALVVIGLFKPGSLENLSVATVGPSLGMIDCNHNEIDDGCDIECGEDCDPSCGGSSDCNGNRVPDECEPDCNENGVADECDIADCLIDEFWCADCNGNNIPDACDPDCDHDGVPDDCDTLDDADCDGIPDCWDLCPLTTPPNTCLCPPLDRCCFPASGICIENYPREICLDQGGTPDCVETPCRDGCLVGDSDNDGDRDLRDVAAFQGCFSGARGDPGYVVPSAECLQHCDFDADQDVDLLDSKELQENLDGPVR